MKRSPRHTAPRTLLALVAVIVLVVSACGSAATPAPTAAPATPGATTAPASVPGSAAASGTKHVSILNKDMTDAEIKAEIQKEGGLVVANWTYTANDELVKQFQDYVKATFGVDIKLTYVGSQSPSEYLTKLAAAKQSNSATPFDVIAVEENYWADAVDQGLVADSLPSDLIPNQKLLLPAFVHGNTALAFQAASFIALLYNKDKAPWIKSFKDLADPRLKGKITLPPPRRHLVRRVPARPCR
jgi:spermidine/putrescine-binding protein